MKNNASKKTGLGLADVLTVVFVVLKLCNVIDWSWIWVLSPTWIPIALYLLFICIILCIKACKNIGMVPCIKCKYRGSTLIGGEFGSAHYYCRKDDHYHPKNHRCKNGEYDKFEQK